MDSRKKYRIIFKSLLYIGLCLAAIPFISSLSTTAKQDNDAWASYYVGDMKAGELKKFPVAWIYKRTADDRNYINRFAHLLQDPYSKTDRQPEAARNVWRSANEDFFIFIPWSTRLGHTVQYSMENDQGSAFSGYPEEGALSKLPFFWDVNDAVVWDMSGRIYKKNHATWDQNLKVPRVEWENKNQVRVYYR